MEQYDYHHGEWKNRKMNVISSQTESAKCSSKFTSNNKGRKAGGCYVESKGLKLYEDVQVFIETLKADINYEVFQRICNNQAREYGLIQEIADDETTSTQDETPTSIQQRSKRVGEQPSVPIFRISGNRGLLWMEAV
jgi:hypothetical protein